MIAGFSRERIEYLLKKPLVRIMLLTILVFSLVALLNLLGLFSSNEFVLLDARFKTRNKIRPVEVDSSIVTIDWDEESITSLGRWPWTWNRHAALFEFLKLYDAKQAAVVDDQFSTIGEVSLPREAAVSLHDQIASTPGDFTPLLPDYNQRFARQLQEFGSAFLCADFFIPEEEGSLTDEQRAGWIELVRIGRDTDRLDAIKATERYSLRGSASLMTLSAIDMKPPVRLLGDQIAGLGFNRIIQDPDGVIRQTPAVVNYEGRLYYTLAIAMAAHRFGCPFEKIRFEPGKYVEFAGTSYPDGRPVRIPVNDRGMMRINWAGPYYGPFQHMPYMALSEQIGFMKAKRVVSGIHITGANLSDVEQTVLGTITSMRFFDSRFNEYIARNLMYAAVAEQFIKSGETFENFLGSYLGGNDADSEGWEIWNSIAMNNLLEVALDNGETVTYAQLLEAVGVKDTLVYRFNYDQASHFHSKGLLAEMHPLYFLKPVFRTIDSHTVYPDPLQLKGKSVFIGLTATALNALNPTPYEDRYMMHGQQPNVLNTILTGQFITDIPSWTVYIFIFVYALTVVILVLYLPTIGQFLTACLLGAVHIGASWYSFATGGIIIPIVAPVISIVAAYSGTVLFRYIEEQRERKKVRGLFSAMVSPDVLKLMEDHPEKISLAGEKKDATMFSSDVSGFTTISEGVTAQELADILNIYLTPMSNLVMKYGGYVDKYEGDAIKASFGVPLPDEEHPWKGACSALEQQEELTAIARMLLLKYGVKITARMGVNTGVVSAGNMGSEKKMQYTVMGEQVTLAEELEPINKLYESWIALGPETQKRSGGIVETRHLDTVLMGPSKHHIDIYEAMGWDRDKYIAYWRDRPVPPLFIEGWKKMSPEKLLGYVYYFERKNLPDSPIKKEVELLIFGLTGFALDAMHHTDTLQTLQLRDQVADLEELIAKYRPMTAGQPVPAYLVPELETADRKIAESKEEWQVVIWKWKKLIREATVIGDLLFQKITDAERHALLKQVDTLDKRTECYIKRCSFPKPDDDIAWKLAEHLKKIVVNVSPEFLKQNRDGLKTKIAEMQKKITDEMSSFLATLAAPERSRMYHEYMADFCFTPEKKKQVREIFNRGRAHYLKQEWDSAESVFHEGLEVDPGDGPCIKYIERVQKFRKHPPAADWDGAWEEE